MHVSAKCTSASVNMSDCLNLRDVSAGYGETVVLEGISLDVAEGGTLGRAGPQRRRQDDAAGDDGWPHDTARAAASNSASSRSSVCGHSNAPG